MSAYPQTTLTGAIQFSTNSTGAGTSADWVWNTLGGDSFFNLWMAQNPDAMAPINGPSDAQAGIVIPLVSGNSYTFYLFGQNGCCSTGFNGLNLFFDGNNSAPGISVFGATNSTHFAPDGSTTLTLQGSAVAGSGSTSYSSNGAIVVLTGYDWNLPADPPGDVCQAMVFSPGNGRICLDL